MTKDEQPEDLIRYDVLTQEALRNVIRKVLEEVASAGLPGEHHFFITFRTDHPGVRLSTRMRERYPEEMTIVVQHSFWDLKVTDTDFEIDLSFDDILERLRIPFASLKGFFDPHVKFGVQFDAEYLEAANADEEAPAAIESEPKLSALPSPDKPTKQKETSAGDSKENDADSDDDGIPSEGAEVVSLDQFRKKQ